jgi:hypothetical protein
MRIVLYPSADSHRNMSLLSNMVDISDACFTVCIALRTFELWKEILFNDKNLQTVTATGI